ncbi:hypothetical protein BH11ACT8_BH11ACT8_16700 [soil metagenome]
MTGLHLVPGRDAAAAIEALAERLGGRAGLDVLGDLNRQGGASHAPGRAVLRALTFDVHDRLDLRWWPQGISTGSHEGRRYAAVSWYAKQLPWDERRHGGKQGSRVTFLDLETHAYRHVLLVEPTLVDGVPGLAPLQVHAGGIVWDDGLLHVAATGKGFHTCRLGDVLRVPGDRPLPTYGYRYVLPTLRRTRTVGDPAVRFSFLSRESSSGDLLVGEYTASGPQRRLARFSLGRGESEIPLRDVGEGVASMQGVAVVDGRHFVTTSHGRLQRGSVWSGAPGDLRRHRAATPMGPEDLHHDPDTDELWTVTEHPWARWLVAMSPEAFRT